MSMKRILYCTTASICLMKGALAGTTFSTGEIQAIKQIVKDCLMESPELITQAMEVLQRQQQAAMAEKAKKLITENHAEIFSDPADQILGNPQGNLQLVMFADPYCSHCREFTSILEEVIQQLPELKVIIKDFPIFGKPSIEAVQMLKLAQMQGKYREMQKIIFNLQAPLAYKKLLKHLHSIKGINLKTLAKHMNDKNIDKKIEKTMALAQKLGLNATPSLIFRDQLIIGGLPLKNLVMLLTAKEGEASSTPDLVTSNENSPEVSPAVKEAR